MKKTLRILSALLALLLLGTGLVACTDIADKPLTTPTPTATGTPTPTEEASDPDENPYNIPDDLPETTAYKDREFTVLAGNTWNRDNFYQDALSGNAIDDAIYNAIANTEERYGVTIVANVSGLDDTAHINFVSNAIASGSDDFQVARVHDTLGANYSLQGTLKNILELKYIDTEKPWYSSATIEALTFMDQWYLFSSTISYNGLSAAGCMFFNKTLMADLGMEEPYARVLSGEWYLDDVVEELENVHVDANNDGIKDMEDTFGMVCDGEFWFWFENFGVDLVTIDHETESLVLDIDNEYAYKLVEDMYDLFVESDTGWMTASSNIPELFTNGHALYINGRLNWAVEIYRDKDVRYGIVPFPKLDYTTEDYYAGYSDSYFIVPDYGNEAELDFVGLMLEAMSAEGYRNIVPAYFDQTLKDRVTWDDDSVKMLDIINQSRLLGFTYVYGNDQWCSRAVYDLLSKGNKDYSAYCEKLRDVAAARIETVTEAFEKMAK